MGLFQYCKDVQRLIRDQTQQIIDFGDLVEYVNSARRQVARRAMCIRVLPPISGAVVSVSVTNPGSGYTAPVATITPPDFPSGRLPFPAGAQATAIATQIGGHLAGVNIVFGGDGYFNPLVTITDPHGTGATATAQVSTINTLNFQQEVYPFSGVDLSPFPGVGEIHAVLGVSVIFDNYRYSLPKYSFTEYQAKVRQYPFQYTYVPAIFTQFGQGASGSLFFYPLPSQTFQMEWDCLCTPSNLQSDLDVDALPDPWQDVVKFYAAHLAYLEMQNFNYARAMLDLFNEQMLRMGQAARPGRVVNPYGRY